ncbi:hypothetical protein JCM10213_005623 [Rhodosporidiobolus nylandii]
MSYASSSSSADEHHHAPDFFSHPFASGYLATGTASPATSISSLYDFEDHWQQLKRQNDAFVGGILKAKHEQEVALRAWRVRCDSLESEVLRLSNLVAQLEREKQEALKAAAQKELKNDEVQTDKVQTDTSCSPSSSPSSASCDCSPDCSAPTPCRWNEARKSWEPLPPPARPTIDPSKPMSRQNPAPCNAFYLIGHCDVPRCRFEHEYELTDEQVQEMKRGAKHHVCNAIRAGVACPDGEDCIYGHVCPRGPACGRERCGFNDEQHRVIPAPRPVVRRR